MTRLVPPRLAVDTVVAAELATEEPNGEGGLLGAVSTGPIRVVNLDAPELVGTAIDEEAAEVGFTIDADADGELRRVELDAPTEISGTVMVGEVPKAEVTIDLDGADGPVKTVVKDITKLVDTTVDCEANKVETMVDSSIGPRSVLVG